MVNHLNLVCGEAKSLEGYFNFIDSILKLCICEVAVWHVCKIFITELSEIIHFGFYSWIETIPNTIGEKNGIKKHGTIPFSTVSIDHGVQKMGFFPLLAWRFTVLEVLTIFWPVFLFT